MKNDYIFGKFLLSGGWVFLVFTALIVIGETTSWDPFQGDISVYIVCGIIGALIVLHYIIFDLIPRKLYTILGVICWLLSYLMMFFLVFGVIWHD